jgi:tetratricopeptide (TPR) repeat protein
MLENTRAVRAAMRSDNDEALARSQRVLQLRTDLLGPDHPMTLRARTNIGAELYYLCRYQQALEFEAETVAKAQAVEGPDTANLFRLRNSLGITKLAVGDLEGSEAELQQAVRISQVVEGPTGDTTLLENLAETQIARGHCEEALANAERSADSARVTMGADAAELHMAGAARGMALQCLDRSREALEALDAAIPAITRTLDADSTLLIEPLLASGNAHLHQGEWAAAQKDAQRALGIIARHCSPPGQRACAQLVAARALHGTRRDEAGAAALAQQALDALQGIARLEADAAQARELLRETKHVK